MSQPHKSLNLSPELAKYVDSHTRPPHHILERVRSETDKLPGAGMQISRDQGAFLHLLVKITGAKRVVELGCFTGSSAISMASALEEGGKLITIDRSAESLGIASKYFADAGLQNKIETRNGSALDILPKLLQEYGKGSFDLAFIDADKTPMADYYELCLQLVRPGGIIAADNVLWSGAVADPADKSESTEGIRRFNQIVFEDPRVDCALTPIADGVYVIRKR